MALLRGSFYPTKQGVSINHRQIFDDDTEWKHLEAILATRLNEETSERIFLVHQKLPILFQQIKTDTKITYPFKYDCITGKFFLQSYRRI